MKCFVKPSDGSHSVQDDFPESFPGYEEAWEAIRAYLEKVQDLPDNAFLVEDEYGNRYRLDEKINHVLEITPATWERLRSKYGATVGVIDYWDIEAMFHCLVGNGYNVEAAAAAEGHFLFGAIYVPDEHGNKILIAYFEDEVAKLWGETDPLPTVPSLPIAPTKPGDRVMDEQISKIVAIISSNRWRKAPQATRKSGSKELWVGYAIAEAMGLDIDAKPTDRAKASKMLEKLIREGILSTYNARDAKANFRCYVCVNK